MSNIITSIKKITNSRYLDYIGVVLVVSISFLLKYHETLYDFEWNQKSYSFYLGYFSIINNF
jgi:hypothetical protein